MTPDLDRPLKAVSREEWLAYIERFPDRQSWKTGICEPPIEVCEAEGRRIALVRFPYDGPKQFFIEEPGIGVDAGVGRA